MIFASLLAVFVWTVVHVVNRGSRQRLFGLLGAWLATLASAALCHPDAAPWIAGSAKELFLICLVALAVLVPTVTSEWRLDDLVSRLVLSCAVFSLVANVAAVLRFLWLATVSAGGV